MLTTDWGPALRNEPGPLPSEKVSRLAEAVLVHNWSVDHCVYLGKDSMIGGFEDAISRGTWCFIYLRGVTCPLLPFAFDESIYEM